MPSSTIRSKVARPSRLASARAPWNTAVDLRPAALAYPADTAEVAAIVRAAARAGLHVAVQTTGHNAGPLGESALADVVLLRTAAMRGVVVDAGARLVTVEAGWVWEDVVRAVAPGGLTALHGSSPDVGVVGYSLGGGMGWYARKLGLQTNSITAPRWSPPTAAWYGGRRPPQRAVLGPPRRGRELRRRHAAAVPRL
jgi:FAD/FMN-containing dehydrogenase